MNIMHYVGLDIHKKSISSCVRQADGIIVQESTIAATHQALDRWMEQLPQPWVAGMEATMFTGWIYDHLNSRGAIAKVGHPAMLKAIGAGKKKNHHIDARTTPPTFAPMHPGQYRPRERLRTNVIFRD